MKYAAFFALAAAAFAADPTVGQIYDRSLSGAESEFMSLAQAMPAEAYNFAPANGEFKTVRTFAQQVKHVAAVNYMVAAAILGAKPPVDTNGENGPDSAATKDQIVAFAKGSFTYLHKAMQSLAAENFTGMIASPFGDNQTPRGSVALTALTHPFDHYGQMVVYARMNGIVPPASR